jgi:hypothetical protein
VDGDDREPSESTTKRDLDYLNRYLLPTFGALPLSAIDHMKVRRWVAALSQQGLAPATVVKAAQIMAKIMRMAVDAGRLVANPCDRVPLPKIERTSMRFLDAAEVAALADSIGDRYRALVLASAYRGVPHRRARRPAHWQGGHRQGHRPDRRDHHRGEREAGRRPSQDSGGPTGRAAPPVRH